MTIGLKQQISNVSRTMENNNKKQEELKSKQWDKLAVKNDLETQIDLLAAGKNNYKTVAKLAASYRLTAKDFRNRCSDDNELMNLFEIYNGVYVEHIMTQAIREGKINSQTEEFLKEEMQAYTNTGTEQLVQWIVSDKEKKQFFAYNEETGKYDKEIRIQTDEEQQTVMPWANLEEENE